MSWSNTVRMKMISARKNTHLKIVNKVNYYEIGIKAKPLNISSHFHKLNWGVKVHEN